MLRRTNLTQLKSYIFRLPVIINIILLEIYHLQQNTCHLTLLLCYLPEVLYILILSSFFPVRTGVFTLRHSPVCHHSSSGLYSVQDQISVAIPQNGCEAVDALGCAHRGDVRASITRFDFIFWFALCVVGSGLFRLFLIYFLCFCGFRCKLNFYLQGIPF